MYISNPYPSSLLKEETLVYCIKVITNQLAIHFENFITGLIATT